MQRHLQWLEGGYICLASQQQTGISDSFLDTSIRLLKLHALFGSKISLSTAQVNDSFVVLHLFNDSTFRRFLKYNKGFFTLSVPFQLITDENPFALATTSLRRSLKSDWVSVAFEKTEISRTIASLILEIGLDNSGYFDEEKLLSKRQESSEFRKVLDTCDLTPLLVPSAS